MSEQESVTSTVVEEQEKTKQEPSNNEENVAVDNMKVIFDTYVTYAITETKITMKKSPFAYYKGMRYNCVMQQFKKENIVEMIHKGKISQTCSIILQALGEYTYLNSFMLRNIVYLKMGRDKELSREKIRSILRQLVERGLIKQYELFHMEDGEEQGSSFIYALSYGGEIYCNYLGIAVSLQEKRKIKKFFIPTMLSILAVNQFHLALISKYGEQKIIKRSNIYKKSYVTANVAGDYAILLPNKEILTMYLTCVRNTKRWADNFIYTIGKLLGYVNEINCRTYFLLVICETEHQVMECERLCKCHGLSKVPLLYTTDTTIAKNSDVFARLIKVTNVENGEKEYLQFTF